jgi:hypothetical protein
LSLEEADVWVWFWSNAQESGDDRLVASATFCRTAVLVFLLQSGEGRTRRRSSFLVFQVFVLVRHLMFLSAGEEEAIITSIPDFCLSVGSAAVV